MMRKLMIVSLVLTMVMSSMLTGCSKTKETKMETVVLNEVAHSIFYAPLYVAMEEGYFEEEGIALELVTGFGADKTMTALLTDEADIGFMGPEATIYTYLGGVEDGVINFAQLTQRAGNFLVAREEITDFSWADLAGTTVIGGRAGGMPQMVFEYILKQNNLVMGEDLTVDQSIDFGATAAAFSGGLGEYTVEFEPFATSLEEMGDGYVVASLGEESGYVPYTAFSAKESYMEENPEVMTAFITAVKKGVAYVEEHTAEEIAAVIQPQFEETETATLTAIVARYQAQDSWKTDLVFEEDAFTLLQNILEEAGELDERVPYGDLVTTEYVLE